MHSEVAPDFTTVYGARAQLKNWSRVPPSLKWAASPFLGKLVFSSSMYQSPEWLTLGGIFRNELKLEMQKKSTQNTTEMFLGTQYRDGTASEETETKTCEGSH